MQFSKVVFCFILVSNLNVYCMEGLQATQVINSTVSKPRTIGQKLHAKALTVHAGNLVLKEGIEELDAIKVKNALEWAYPQFCHDRNTTYLHLITDRIADDQSDSPELTQARLILSHLIKAGVSVNAKNAAEQTPLFVALKNQNTRLVNLYIAAGAVIDQNSLEYLKQLRAQGVDFNKDPWSNMLKWSIEAVSADNVKILLELGVYPEASDDLSDTYLHRMVDIIFETKSPSERYTQAYYVVNHLVKAGANVHARNANQQTPLDVALTQYDHEVVVPLIEAGAIVNQSLVAKLKKRCKTNFSGVNFKVACHMHNTLTHVMLTASHAEVLRTWQECVTDKNRKFGKTRAIRPFEDSIKLVKKQLLARKFGEAQEVLGESLQPVTEIVIKNSIEQVIDTMLPILKQAS